MIGALHIDFSLQARMERDVHVLCEKPNGDKASDNEGSPHER